MMAFKDGIGQIIKLPPARLTGIPLTMSLMGMFPAFCDLSTVAGWASNTRGPTQLPNNFIALGIIDQGLDIYDPIKDEIKARNLHDIAYWMVDENYDGSNFIVKQVFFCGGDRHEFDKWKKGLDTLAKDNTRKKVEKTLKIEIDEEAFDRLYGFVSHPIVTKKGQKIAVRIVSQFGEECTKVMQV